MVKLIEFKNDNDYNNFLEMLYTQIVKQDTIINYNNFSFDLNHKYTFFNYNNEIEKKCLTDWFEIRNLSITLE